MVATERPFTILPRHSVPRLSSIFRVVRDGVRPSRARGEDRGGHATFGSGEPQATPRGNREVRYRLCELSPCSHIFETRISDSGDARVCCSGNKRVFQTWNAGSIPATRSGSVATHRTVARHLCGVALSPVTPDRGLVQLSPCEGRSGSDARRCAVPYSCTGGAHPRGPGRRPSRDAADRTRACAPRR